MKTRAKTLVPIAAAAMTVAAATAFYVHTETTAGVDGTHRYRAVHNPPAAKVAQAYVGNPDDPATWRLPVEAYMPTQRQAQLVSTKRDELIDTCVEKAGYPAWKPAPTLPELGGKTLTDWRYGIHDASLAARRGYHPDADEQRVYDEAQADGAVDQSGTPDEVVRGCTEKVDGKVPPAAPAEIVQRIGGESFTASEKATEVKTAFAKWSACMKAKGYRYVKPMDANDDPRFSDPSTVTKREIATAEADIVCRNKNDVARTWFDAESKIQSKKIAQHLKEFNAAAASTRDAVAKAKAA